eukprot:CAMPEP_0113262456 /NCGR_PEP_ID=MMETSP0008_2-20120614/17934_1 /TAXON_ID=97485 /ORGANISM="Prymnesium parvum" /LENGTH=152 /DNA_ID=CAMNT_0000111121 /DNA_START=277 /DNA_END=731 /DNA_ORIENTATION=- /assembly_acc=CAM_ASM_000153
MAVATGRHRQCERSIRLPYQISSSSAASLDAPRRQQSSQHALGCASSRKTTPTSEWPWCPRSPVTAPAAPDWRQTPGCALGEVRPGPDCDATPGSEEATPLPRSFVTTGCGGCRFQSSSATPMPARSTRACSRYTPSLRPQIARSQDAPAAT